MRRLGRLCGPCGKPARDLDSVKLTSPSQVTLAVRRDDVLAGRARPSKPGAAPAAPAAPEVALPDFSGRWVLTGSRNFDEYLSAMGVNYVKRKLAAGMKPLQEWTLVDGSWQFSVSTPVGIRVESFPLGVHVPDEVDGVAMVKRSMWDGAVLHTSVVPNDPNMSAQLGSMTMCARGPTPRRPDAHWWPRQRARHGCRGSRARAFASCCRQTATPPPPLPCLACTAGGGTCSAQASRRSSCSR